MSRCARVEDVVGYGKIYEGECLMPAGGDPVQLWQIAVTVVEPRLLERLFKRARI